MSLSIEGTLNQSINQSIESNHISVDVCNRFNYEITIGHDVLFYLLNHAHVVDDLDRLRVRIVAYLERSLYALCVIPFFFKNNIKFRKYYLNKRLVENQKPT